MRSRISTLILAGLLLGASASCSTSPKELRDPAFAPAMPAAAPPARPNNGAIYQVGYQPSYGMALFEDVKAYQIGDILTIELVEKTDASKQASTSAGKEQSIDFEGPTLFGRGVTKNGVPILSTSVSGTRDFSGEGASNQSNSLSGSITVTVANVLSNGNLEVRGQKVMTLNQGDEFIRIRGIVRPQDIRPDNTVLSTKVADAEIVYGGTGVLADSNQQGWLARFFNSSWWPF